MRAPSERTAAVGAGLTFWIALIALVVNDHALKGSGLAPGWLTGKLSDFAGLIVAPVVLAGLLRARSARGRLVCIALVALVFAGFELIPAWADALASLDAFGLRLRTWPDLSDLLALAILPVTAWVLARRPLTPTFLQRAGLIAGGVACLATDISTSMPQWPVIENRSHLPIAITVRRYLGPVDCESMSLEFDGVGPAAADFGEPITAVLEPSEPFGLGEDGDADEPCGAFWLASPQLPDLIFGAQLGPIPQFAKDRVEDQATLIIEGPAAELRAYGGPGVWIADVPAPGGAPRP